MPRISFKAAALASAVSLGALAASHQPADAGGRHHGHHHHRGGGGIAAAAIAGLAVGAIIAGSSSRRYERNYYHAPPPPPRYYAPPVAYYAPQPWSPEWYDYCSRKYRSFDPRSGTYQPYHGPRRFCQ